MGSKPNGNQKATGQSGGLAGRFVVLVCPSAIQINRLAPRPPQHGDAAEAQQRQAGRLGEGGGVGEQII